MTDLQLSSARQQFIHLSQLIDKTRIANLVESQQQGKLTLDDKMYYEHLIDEFITLVKLPKTAHFAMQVLPEFKILVPALLDGMAYRALADKEPKSCLFACYMIDQSLLERDLSPLFEIILTYGTPDLWLELVKKVNHAPAELIVAKVYECDKAVQDFWENSILQDT